MSPKQVATEAIERLPDAATLKDIMGALYFCQKIDRGLKALDEGRVLTHEEAKGRLARWRQY